MTSSFGSGLQILAIFLVSLLAGAMFGIWRGYDPTSFTPSTFVEVHQGSVRGLNFLLPAMGAVSLVLVLVLAFIYRAQTPLLGIFAVAAVLMIAAGLITRFMNQPINAEVMNWTATSLPDNWTSLRDKWWVWHITRMASTALAELLLLAALAIRI